MVGCILTAKEVAQPANNLVGAFELDQALFKGLAKRLVRRPTFDTKYVVCRREVIAGRGQRFD
jgi:hypothetical protein